MFYGSSESLPTLEKTAYCTWTRITERRRLAANQVVTLYFYLFLHVYIFINTPESWPTTHSCVELSRRASSALSPEFFRPPFLIRNPPEMSYASFISIRRGIAMCNVKRKKCFAWLLARSRFLRLRQQQGRQTDGNVTDKIIIPCEKVTRDMEVWRGRKISTHTHRPPQGL